MGGGEEIQHITCTENSPINMSIFVEAIGLRLTRELNAEWLVAVHAFRRKCEICLTVDSRPLLPCCLQSCLSVNIEETKFYCMYTCDELIIELDRR